MSAPGADNRATGPLVWVVGAYRAGEQGQLLALANALGYRFELKPVRHRWQGGLLNLFRGTGLSSVKAEDRNQFKAPWPDIVIAAGMKNEPVCRWIRDASGGRTRIVHVGRPWADPSRMDLVITTPQYRLPVRDNVLHNALTMHSVDERRLEQAVGEHQDRLKALPQPHIAVVLGGGSGPYHFGVKAARRLARQASALARSLNGSLLISSSARTDGVAVDALEAELEVPYELYRFRPQDPANPYFAYLGSAQHLIVTFDSISMISEACATGKPVYLFDLARVRRADGNGPVERDTDLRSLGYRLLMRFGPRRLGRDIGLVHQRLIEEKRAIWFDGQVGVTRAFTGSPDLELAVTRVRQLVSQG